ncbi:hypothetical protein EYF80_038023 [Liparis tanakae]|uniref:Uncharacterized protein n=1 Tax=Liparis tanakae TaxID=230148 RepID=A0A4Z2GF42_9TELE|nr:hypothetical protein EYF80_038023 [Liparis tanakae]
MPHLQRTVCSTRAELPWNFDEGENNSEQFHHGTVSRGFRRMCVATADVDLCSQHLSAALEASCVLLTAAVLHGFKKT